MSSGGCARCWRKQEPERQPFDLNVAVERCCDAFGCGVPAAAGDARPSAPRDANLIVGDQTQIQQVLIILVLNAMDAVADVPEHRRTVVMSIEKAAGNISITVRDRGRGIAPEHLTKVFDSFFSTKQRGMGLGLSIARTIVESHGGRIRAESGAGEGAVFHVDLPARDDSDGASLSPVCRSCSATGR